MFGFSAFSSAPFSSLSGNTYSVDLAEAVSASDAFVNTLTAVGLLVEAASAADSLSPNFTYSVSTNETGTAADVQSNVTTMFAALSDSVFVSDAYSSAGSIFNAGVAETGVLDDGFGVGGSIYFTQTGETVSALDLMVARLFWEPEPETPETWALQTDTPANWVIVADNSSNWNIINNNT